MPGSLDSIAAILALASAENQGGPFAAGLFSIVKLMESEIAALSASFSVLQSRNQGEKILPGWYADVVQHLGIEVQIAFARMLPIEPTMFNLPLVAFGARSSLELAVWVEFCIRSEQNARRFYDDRYRDGIGLHLAFCKLLELAPALATAETTAALAHLQDHLCVNAAADGVTSINASYLSVAEASSQIDSGGIFIALNRLLSKHAHPTAIMLFRPLRTEEERNSLSAFFKMLGSSAAAISLRMIANFLRSRGISPSG